MSLVGIILLAAIAFAVLWSYNLSLQATAQSLILEVEDLGRTQNRTERFDRLRRRYRQRLRPSDQCTHERCYYKITVTNRVLAALRITPYTELKAYFQIRDDNPTGTLLEYRAAFRDGVSPVVHVQDDFYGGVDFFVNPHDADGQVVSNGLVMVNTTTNADQKAYAYALNVNCLTQIGGCRDGRNLLPGIW